MIYVYVLDMTPLLVLFVLLATASQAELCYDRFCEANTSRIYCLRRYNDCQVDETSNLPVCVKKTNEDLAQVVCQTSLFKECTCAHDANHAAYCECRIPKDCIAGISIILTICGLIFIFLSQSQL